MAHGDARRGKWRGNWRKEWVARTLHTTSEHGVSSITTADARTLAASSRLNWRPRRFKWTRPFLRKTKSGFFACAITFQTHFYLRLQDGIFWNAQMLDRAQTFSERAVICRVISSVSRDATVFCTSRHEFWSWQMRWIWKLYFVWSSPWLRRMRILSE